MKHLIIPAALFALASVASAQSPLLPVPRGDLPMIPPENVSWTSLEDGSPSTESAAVVFDNLSPGPSGYLAFASAPGPIGFEDYTSLTPGLLTLDVSKVRFVGGVADAGGVIAFEFFDAAGAVFNGGFQVALPAAGNFIWTIGLPSGLVITDGAGLLQLRVDGNTTSGGQWFVSDAIPIVGSENPTVGSGSGSGFQHLFQLSNFPTTGGPYCFGDDLEDPQLCPCGNPSVGAGSGCANSTGSGAVLGASGVADTAADSFVLNASGLPASVTTVFFQGNGPTAAGGVGLPFGDGLRCAAGGIRRLEVSTSDGSGSASSSVSLSVAGGVVSGGTVAYQGWYRDVGGPCMTGSNTTNAWLQVWL